MTTAGACFLAQALALFILATAWVEASNHSWECGYDGTCIDRGLFGAIITAQLLVPAAEFVLATLWWALAFRRQRQPLAGHAWRPLFTLHLPRTVISGGLLSALAVIVWRLLA